MASEPVPSDEEVVQDLLNEDEGEGEDDGTDPVEEEDPEVEVDG